MKNIYEILSGAGIEVPEDKKAELDKEIAVNYKTVAEVEKKNATITSLQEQLKTATDGLKAFEGVDVNDLQGQIAKLQRDLATKDTEHQTEIANMEFEGRLFGAIANAKGKSAKAISALLDLDALKASKNQETDIKDALDKLREDSGYLFEEDNPPPPYASGTGTDPVGGKNNTSLVGALRERYSKGR